MFDVLDIQIPSIQGLRVDGGSDSMRLADDGRLFAGRVLLGSVVDAASAYSHDWWTGGSGSRRSWTVIVAAQAAGLASANDQHWAAFAGGIRDVLSSSPDWRAIAESDCDQHDLTRLATVEDFVDAITRARSGGLHPLSVIAEAGRGVSPGLPRVLASK